MEQSIKKLFKQAVYHPESRLSGDIWRIVCEREKRASLISSWIYGTIGVVSFAIFIPVVNSLMVQFSQSGFYQYLSLAFSDLGSISMYWQEFMSSLAEAIPTTSLIFALLLLFIFLVSLKRAFVNFKSPLLSI